MPTEAVTEVPTEVIEVVMNTELEALNAILGNAQQINEVSHLIAGMLLFFVVVALCYFSYKFFRIFF